ncbi:SH3 domain-protein [Podospora conica]|nr:SH3 domain-protein [Schizothecium conicum]
MDPVSALGLVVTCTSLLSNIVKITSALHGLRERYKTAELTCLSLISQLSTLEASTSELKVVLNNQAATINRRDNLLKALDESLDSTTRVVSYIWDELSETKSALEGGRLGRWARTKYGFTESGLAPMKEALRDQIQAIHLLLSVATLPTENDQNDLLNDSESVRTLERAKDDSRSSLLWLRDADSRTSFISYQSDTLSRLSMVFGFDDAVLGSKPYRAAVMATWKGLKERRQSMRITPARPQPVSMYEQDTLTGVSMLSEPCALIVAHAALQTGKNLLMIAKFDFAAERPDECEVREGEVLICMAITNEEWVVAQRIMRLGAPGLVPIEYVTVFSRAGKPCESVEVALDELRAAGVPSTTEWKRLVEEYKIECRESVGGSRKYYVTSGGNRENN